MKVSETNGKGRVPIYIYFLGLVLLAGCSAINPGQQKNLPLAWPVNLPFEKILPGTFSNYEVMRYSSEFCHEYLFDISRLSSEGLKMECKKGRSGSGHKPWLMVRNVKTQRGLAISLAYSGNWRIEVLPQGEDTLFRAATLPESLKPFKAVNGLPIPGALVAEFEGPWDNGAQPITRFIRAKLLRNLGDDWPWVQYNTWYERPHGKRHLLSEEGLIKSARLAAKLGCELFVIDAGWYGQDASADWNESLGDWYVNRQRLPNGIEPVAEEVRKLGMKFGMWIEIECANPNSPVGRAHPDWFLRDGEKLASTRNCLDFGNPEALAWAIAEIDRMVTTYKLDYIKMDFGTDLTIDSERYTDQPDPLWRHYRGLVKLWEHTRNKYPELIIENCSSGSLRHDLLTAAHSDTHWVSDAVKNEDNLILGFGATYLFPPETCNHWTCYPNKSSDVMDVESCFTATMLGQMGLSGPATSWNEEICRRAAERIALYKRIRPVIRNADVYHLTDQADRKTMNMIQALQYLDRRSDRSVVFAFQGGDARMTIVLKLYGLKPDVSYRVCMPPSFGPDRFVKGSKLMQDGLDVCFPHKGASAVIQISPSRAD